MSELIPGVQPGPTGPTHPGDGPQGPGFDTPGPEPFASSDTYHPSAAPLLMVLQGNWVRHLWKYVVFTGRPDPSQHGLLWTPEGALGDLEPRSFLSCKFRGVGRQGTEDSRQVRLAAGLLDPVREPT